MIDGARFFSLNRAFSPGMSLLGATVWRPGGWPELLAVQRIQTIGATIYGLPGASAHRFDAQGPSFHLVSGVSISPACHFYVSCGTFY